MSPRIRLRSACVADVDAAVPLLVEALDHLALELAGAATHAEALALFRELFVACGNRYSHEHVSVLESDDAIAAVALAYPGKDEAALAEPVLAWLRERDPASGHRHETESAPDEFYLDALAVAPTQRGRGHAARLIDAVCAQAGERGYARVGLLVDVAKPGVKRLYQRLGFAVDGERSLAGHRHEHMVRRLVD